MKSTNKCVLYKLYINTELILLNQLWNILKLVLRTILKLSAIIFVIFCIIRSYRYSKLSIIHRCFLIFIILLSFFGPFLEFFFHKSCNASIGMFFLETIYDPEGGSITNQGNCRVVAYRFVRRPPFRSGALSLIGDLCAWFIPSFLGG